MDIVPGWLRDKWNERKEKQRIRAHHKEQHEKLNQAITDKDAPKIAEIIEQTEKADVFISHRYNSFLRAAVRTNDLETFEAVHNLSDSPSPNYVFYDHSPMVPGAVSHFTYRTPLLSYAIDNGAENVALALAQDPQTNIYQQSNFSKSTYHSGGFLSSGHTERKNKEYPLPRVIAEEKGMANVAAVLAQREADDLTAKVAQLRSKPS